MKRVLVTGAGGFVGSHLCRGLTDAGHHVVALLGPTDVFQPAAATVLRADVQEGHRLAPALRDCDALIHLAGPSSAAASFEDPGNYARIHVAGTAEVMRQANRAGTPQRLLISSAEVYGAPGKIVDETSSPEPISPYGAAKLGAEWISRTLCSASDVHLTILRPFSLFGARMRQNALLWVIRQHILDGTQVQLATLKPVRDHLHIGDFARLVAAALSSKDAPLILNACSGEGFSVGQIAVMALELAGRGDAPVAATAMDRPTDVEALIGSNRLAERTCGWRPSKPFRGALQDFLTE